MGAINNAFNQAAGAVAGAALAYKHAQETEFSKMNAADNSALAARNQARVATAEADEAFNEAYKDGGLIQQLDTAKGVEEEAKEAYERAAKRKNGSRVTRLQKMSDLVAARMAADTLRDKYKAFEDLQDRADEQREYAAKATKMALDEKTKYEKHWGGIK